MKNCKICKYCGSFESDEYESWFVCNYGRSINSLSYNIMNNIICEHYELDTRYFTKNDEEDDWMSQE